MCNTTDNCDVLAIKVSKKAKKTQFSLSGPQAEKVFIAGDFNQWNLGFTSSESK